jgi:hypothetical protein
VSRTSARPVSSHPLNFTQLFHLPPLKPKTQITSIRFLRQALNLGQSKHLFVEFYMQHFERWERLSKGYGEVSCASADVRDDLPLMQVPPANGSDAVSQ